MVSWAWFIHWARVCVFWVLRFKAVTELKEADRINKKLIPKSQEFSLTEIIPVRCVSCLIHRQFSDVPVQELRRCVFLWSLNRDAKNATTSGRKNSIVKYEKLEQMGAEERIK